MFLITVLITRQKSTCAIRNTTKKVSIVGYPTNLELNINFGNTVIYQLLLSTLIYFLVFPFYIIGKGRVYPYCIAGIFYVVKYFAKSS